MVSLLVQSGTIFWSKWPDDYGWKIICQGNTRCDKSRTITDVSSITERSRVGLHFGFISNLARSMIKRYDIRSSKCNTCLYHLCHYECFVGSSWPAHCQRARRCCPTVFAVQMYLYPFVPVMNHKGATDLAWYVKCVWHVTGGFATFRLWGFTGV